MQRKELIGQLRDRVKTLETVHDELRDVEVPAHHPVARDLKHFRMGASAALKQAREITSLSDDEIEATDKKLGERIEQVANVTATGNKILAGLADAKEWPRSGDVIPPKLEEPRPAEPGTEGLEKELSDLLEKLNTDLKELCELQEPPEELATQIGNVRDALAKFVPAARRLLTRASQARDDRTRAEIWPRLRQAIKDAKVFGGTLHKALDEYDGPYEPVIVEPTRREPRREVPTSSVTLRRAELQPTSDQPLWSVIRNRTGAIAFNPYKAFIDQVMCYDGFPAAKQAERREFELRLPFMRADGYTRLKVATELFMMQECGILVEERQRWDFKEPQWPADPDYPFENKPDAAASPEGDRRRLLNRMEEAQRLGRERPEDASGERLMEDLQNEYLVSLGREYYTLPYFALIREKLKELPLKGKDVVPPNCYGILKDKLTGPCLLELIWSFWHEAGFMIRSMHVVNRRFQNIRGGDRDPLTRFDLDSLRPLGNLLWGHVADEQHRLTIQRRVYEYDHHYGLRLANRPGTLHPADSRSKFIGAFHNLLYLTSIFYKEDDDTTVIADAFRVLNALREVHLLLAEGAHNQFGDLPWTARAEMLMEQWLLARPEMREFLGGKIAVPYAEPWMDRVDVMKNLQGWTDVSITHFHDLAVHGEQILLSVRYGNWSVVNFGPQAANWARYWRPEIQRYIHAYQAVTGVDLAIEPVDTTSPAELLRQRASAPR